MSTWIRIVLLIAALLPAVVLAQQEDSAGGRPTFEDYERARRAVEQGEILPLTEILDLVERRFGARMIEVELEIEAGEYAYEIELIEPSGRVIEARVDAATGEVLGVEPEDGDD